MNNPIQCLWDQQDKLTQRIESERAKSVPDVNELRWLQRRKKKIDDEIELVEGLVRTLARPTPPSGPGGVPNRPALT